VETRNLTLHLPKELVRKAKVYAAQHDTSINSLVKELLEEKVSSEDKVLAAGKRILESSKRGPHSSVDISALRREDLYERW
jgi:hypothetical protein